MEGDIRIEFRSGAGGEPFVYLAYKRGTRAATFDGLLLGRETLADIVSHAVRQIILRGEWM